MSPKSAHSKVKILEEAKSENRRRGKQFQWLPEHHGVSLIPLESEPEGGEGWPQGEKPRPRRAPRRGGAESGAKVTRLELPQPPLPNAARARFPDPVIRLFPSTPRVEGEGGNQPETEDRRRLLGWRRRKVRAEAPLIRASPPGRNARRAALRAFLWKRAKHKVSDSWPNWSNSAPSHFVGINVATFGK